MHLCVWVSGILCLLPNLNTCQSSHGWAAKKSNVYVTTGNAAQYSTSWRHKHGTRLSWLLSMFTTAPPHLFTIANTFCLLQWQNITCNAKRSDSNVLTATQHCLHTLLRGAIVFCSGTSAPFPLCFPDVYGIMSSSFAYGIQSFSGIKGYKFERTKNWNFK